jgi:hypothetical protein
MESDDGNERTWFAAGLTTILAVSALFYCRDVRNVYQKFSGFPGG